VSEVGGRSATFQSSVRREVQKRQSPEVAARVASHTRGSGPEIGYDGAVVTSNTRCWIRWQGHR